MILEVLILVLSPSARLALLPLPYGWLDSKDRLRVTVYYNIPKFLSPSLSVCFSGVSGIFLI